MTFVPLSRKPLTYTYPAWADHPRLSIVVPLQTIHRTERPRTDLDRFTRVEPGPTTFTIDDEVVDRETFVAAWVAAGRDAAEVP